MGGEEANTMVMAGSFAYRSLRADDGGAGSNMSISSSKLDCSAPLLDGGGILCLDLVGFDKRGTQLEDSERAAGAVAAKRWEIEQRLQLS